MGNINEERIDEYNEEIRIIEEGLPLYKKEQRIASRDLDKWLAKRKCFDLELERKSKTAAALQLGELMNQQEARMKKDIKIMKDNWHNVLKLAMDNKDKFSRDHKLQVTGIKRIDVHKTWQGDEHKVAAYKTLLEILNRYGNGKSL